jgi:adenylate cyclase
LKRQRNAPHASHHASHKEGSHGRRAGSRTQAGGDPGRRRGRLQPADGSRRGGHARPAQALRKELIEPRIAEHHGRIVKLTGDGALVEFPSVVEAVLCAVSVQGIVAERNAEVLQDQRFEFRVGVNLGDVIFDENDIYGDGVNVAARLQTLAEPGGIYVSRTVYDHVKNKVGLAFEPMGEHRVKNIAEPITVYRVLPGPGGAAKPRPAALAPLLLPDKPSIAVLRFENFSDDPKQARLADGITEDIITDLSRFRDLFVTARNSTFVYKDKATDVRQIARELGVQYVLEGSLQTDGKRVRITAQLIDATTGNHVWSERYDRPLDDIFAVQGEVTQTIAASLAGQYGGMARAGREVARRKPPENLQAYEYYLLGLEAKHRFTKEDNKKAQELFGKAIDLDPNFARAYVGLVWTHNLEINFGWTDSWQQCMDNWFVASKAALADDHLDAEAHLTLGLYHLYLNNFAHGLAESERALADLAKHGLDFLDADLVFRGPHYSYPSERRGRGPMGNGRPA